MAGHLVFTLYAPLAGWGPQTGSNATTARKASQGHPSRSHVLGLVGAALGLQSHELPRLEAYLLALRVGIAPVREPKPDYHTVANGRRPKGKTRWTRFEELRWQIAGDDGPGTMLSAREHVSHGLWTAALTPRPEADLPFPLEEIAQALRAPVYPLHAGRRACPLGLPPDPKVVEQPGMWEAFDAYGWPWARSPEKGVLATVMERLRQDALRPHDATGARPDKDRTDFQVFFDEGYPGGPASNRRQVRRRDVADHRLHDGALLRLFRERVEVQASLAKPSPP